MWSSGLRVGRQQQITALLMLAQVHKDTFRAQSLLEASKGRITVIAAAPSPLITDFWLPMPQGARLVLNDLSVKDYALYMRPFARGVGLHVCDLSEAFKVDQALLQVTLQTSIDLVKRVTLPASHSLNVEELSDLDNARRVIAETGADVLSFKYGEDKIKSLTTPEPVRFSGDSIYLLIGCLAGLGHSLTTWMLERGCRNFVSLSRSGTAKLEAADVVQHLQESGANVDVFCVDASDETAVANVVSTVSAQGSIKGVVHAAMVLKDGLYQTMTFSAYQTVMRPKVKAALVLDKVLGDMPLDFFIMTSSMSVVLSNQGQANYAAANSFLDFLALQCRRQGRVACSLALPTVEDVGVVAENTSIADSLARKMPFGIDEREMLSSFEAAIIQGASSGKEVQLGDVQLILSLEPPAMLVVKEGLDLSDAFWYKDERMRPILEELEALAAVMGKTGGGGGLESFTSKLVGLSADESLLAIGSHSMERSARILGAQAEDFQYESNSVSSHGFDSMVGVELQSWLFKESGVQVSIQIILGTNTTFAGLTKIISEHLGIV
ncbi:reducing polyketide synthase FUB1 [Colletotrichum spaethianum]|uniref:Reducing polyketide synthase FUB1 n=1 Tax=Colletotrichum spaethianum TaxID=700344 RepID=A0AA37UQX6_9PEZI|nr:reducing polyketide synthase FUB1 [Colletotrichum spaethianum]GKT49652.1 reducing polyketide synthase FUB1 [Colletotrichum spaethianum]